MYDIGLGASMDTHPTQQLYKLKFLVKQLYDLTASETIDVGDYADASMALVDSIFDIVKAMPEPPWVWQICVSAPFLLCGTKTDAEIACRGEEKRLGRVGFVLMMRAPNAEELEHFHARAQVKS